MSVRYKPLFFVLFILILVSPVFAATIAGGKYFHSENFTSSIGGNFRVYGVDPYYYFNNDTGLNELRYRRAIIMSDIDETVSVLNGTCESTPRFKYCYEGSSINYDDERTFEDSKVLSVMSIIIDSVPSPSVLIQFMRNTTIYAYCGELITIPIDVKNDGMAPTNITYTEILPYNTLITSSGKGVVSENVITFHDTVSANSSKNFSYVMINLDCQSKEWNAAYTFSTFNGSVLSKNFTGLNLSMQSAFVINDSMSRNVTNDLMNETVYAWTINNTHTSINLLLNASMVFSGAGIVVTDKSLGLTFKDNVFKYNGLVPVGKSLTLRVKFYTLDYGDYTVRTSGTAYINDHRMEFNSSKTLDVVKSRVDVYMVLNNTANKSMAVSIWAKNYDINSKYYYLYGILRGIGEEEPLSYNILEPNSEVLVARTVYNTTSLGSGNVTVIFDGVYRDRDNKEYKFYLSQTVDIGSSSVPITIHASPEESIAGNSSVSSTDVTVIDNTTQVSSGNSITGGSQNIKSADPELKEKKDLITRSIEALSEFLQSIFG